MDYLHNVCYAVFSVLRSKWDSLCCLLPSSYIFHHLNIRYNFVAVTGENCAFLRVIDRIRPQCTCSLFKRWLWRIDDIGGDGLWEAVALSGVQYHEFVFRTWFEKSVKLFQWQFCVLTRRNFSPFLTKVSFCYWQLNKIVCQRPAKIN